MAKAAESEVGALVQEDAGAAAGRSQATDRNRCPTRGVGRVSRPS